MGTIKSPETFSSYFGLDRNELARLGALDPTLAADTKLFVDPLLLEGSSVPEIRVKARKSYTDYFGLVLKLLAKAKPGGAAWRAAENRLRVPEIPGTCLGFGDGGVRGSALGEKLAKRLLETAQEIVDLGINDPDLFAVIPLLEKGIGADRISDLTTRVILPDLLEWNERVYRDHLTTVKREDFVVEGIEARLPANPYEKRTPVILVPRDVLRDLPLATDWSGIDDAIAFNAVLRKQVNALITGVWDLGVRRRGRRGQRKPTKAELKELLRQQALNSKTQFQFLLDAVRAQPRTPYKLDDPKGVYRWTTDGQECAQENPLRLTPPKKWEPGDVANVVEAIVDQFTFLVEKRGLWKNLWRAGKPLPEKYAQGVFFAVAYSYCKSNGLDLTPEADTGTGVVDFKISVGFEARVVVEMKLSTNGKLVQGFTKQLNTYRESEETEEAFYVVIDQGRLGEKMDQIDKIRADAIARGEKPSEVREIDANPKRSASKR